MQKKFGSATVTVRAYPTRHGAQEAFDAIRAFVRSVPADVSVYKCHQAGDERRHLLVLVTFDEHSEQIMQSAPWRGGEPANHLIALAQLRALAKRIPVDLPKLAAEQGGDRAGVREVVIRPGSRAGRALLADGTLVARERPQG